MQTKRGLVLIIGFVLIANVICFAQTGTFDFELASNSSGEVKQTVDGVEVTLSNVNENSNSNLQLINLYNDGNPGNELGTTGYSVIAQNTPEVYNLNIAFSQSVRITQLHCANAKTTASRDFTFTPNSGTPVTQAISGSSGQTVTLNFIDITSISVSFSPEANIQVVIDDIEMDAALPVELISFTANPTDLGVELNWLTATEVNNYGFEVERASSTTTPVQGWEVIGFVQGHGNSNSPKSYEFTDTNPPSGELNYRLKQIDTDGSFEYYNTIATVNADVTGLDENHPEAFELSQNYPNPFNPVTNIAYSLETGSDVSLKVFDTLGREVAELVNTYKSAGSYSAEFDATGLQSGMYFYRLMAGNKTFTRKMLLIK